MRPDFAVFILTYKRPDGQRTYRALRSHGYTGKVFFVVDDKDPTLNEYRKRFGEAVVVFSKERYAALFDEGDNSQDRRSVLYARNASFDLAKEAGVRFFVQLDDDYNGFYYRFDGNGHYGNWKLDSLDWLFSEVADYLAATPFASVALSQGGDHIGGGAQQDVIGSKRKAMNSFFCDTEKPFGFVGRLNDDVNTVISNQRRGRPFLTFMGAQLNQAQTQQQSGGLTDLYLDSGTYVKSFYSVMFEPSCAKVGLLKDTRNNTDGHARIHHVIDWAGSAPAIISEKWKKSHAC